MLINLLHVPDSQKACFGENFNLRARKCLLFAIFSVARDQVPLYDHHQYYDTVRHSMDGPVGALTEVRDGVIVDGGNTRRTNETTLQR